MSTRGCRALGTRSSLHTQAATLDRLIHDGGAKHHLANSGTSLRILSEVIPLGAPVDEAVSIGDLCVQVGVAWFIVLAMPRRHPKIVRSEATT